MRKTIFLFIPLLFVQLVTTAQQLELSEMSKLIISSFGHHPKFMELDASIQIANERLKLTSMNTRPELNADFNYSYVMPRIELPINGQKVQFAPVNNVNTFLSSNYVLLDFGRQKLALERSRQEWQTAQHTKDAAAFGLAYQVASIYYQLIYLRKAVSIQDTAIRVLEAARRIAHIQFQEGTALAIDSLSIQANLLQEENRKIELMSLVHKQEILLEYGTGEKLSDASRQLPVIPAMTPDTIHPDLLLLTDQWTRSKLDVQSSQLKARPLLQLRALAGTRNGYVPSVNDLRFNYSAGFGFSVPLYSGGKIRQQVRIQERVADRQAAVLKTTEMELARDRRVMEEEVHAAEARVMNWPTQIQLAEQILQLAMSKYRNGTGLYLEVVSAGGGLQKSLLGYLQGQYQVCMAQLELARLKGIRFWAQ